MTWSPPSASTSTMEYSPKGRMLTSTGRRRASALKSSWLMDVGPQVDAGGAGDLDAVQDDVGRAAHGDGDRHGVASEAGVTMSLGRMPRPVMVRRQSTIWSGNSVDTARVVRGGDTMCSGSRPSTAMNVCMVL